MSFYTFEMTGKVEFYDCDPMCVVWHGNYLKYLEAARGRFLELIDYPYLTVGQEGNVFPVVDLRLKFTSSLKLGDTYTVVTDLDEYENRLVHSFVIKTGDRVCVKARSVQVRVAAGSSELSFFMPENFIRNVRSFLERQGTPAA
ncbi:acyl-CoA thioesterase [Succinimonas amylolytica]|uniref:acyl-CoA thioesterase n=1 Tax=Succinimonas amylolytica TaxID=83769 RepID=UPI00037DF0F8|nr:acyl-CoA thioesterase [Succinimonas amylolytica]